MTATALILAGARTPFCTWASGVRGDGTPGGALKGLDPFDLGAAALQAALARARLPADAVDRVVFGHMYQAGPHGCYGSRYVSLRAGVPAEVPCLTPHMSCGTGLHALIEAAADVRGGEAACVATGGADCVSRLRKEIFVSSFTDLACGSPIGKTVEGLARELGVTRAAADAWALESHRRALAAAKRLAEELVAVAGARCDDAVLAAPSPEAFRAAKPSFEGEGVVTSANTHAVVDGGSALLVASEDFASERGVAPLGRFVAGAYAALEPARMGYGSVPAVKALLKRADWGTDSVDLWEVNETFAAQFLIDVAELKLDPERVNVNGGGVALGHPFAATGARQVLALLLELRRRGLKRGVASICVGGGQGVAVAVEAL